MNRPGLYQKVSSSAFPFRGDVIKFDIWRDRNTFKQLVCTCDTSERREWCEHHEEIINTERDAPYLNGKINVIIYANPWLVVPVEIMPDPNTGLQRVELHINSKNASASWCTVGYKTPAEGNLSIRKMVVDYLSAVPDVEDASQLVCNAKTHSRGDSALEGFFDLKDRITPEERKRILIDIWDTITTGWCRGCNDVVNIPDVSTTPGFRRAKQPF